MVEGGAQSFDLVFLLVCDMFLRQEQLVIGLSSVCESRPEAGRGSGVRGQDL